MMFDLSEIDPSIVVSLTLELVVVQGTFIGSLEAMGFESHGLPLDPFVYSTFNPEPGACSDPSVCPAFVVEKPDGSTNYSFGFHNDDRRQPADVTSAIEALSGANGFLQLSLIPANAFGAQFGHSGFVVDIAPTLIVETAVAEPTPAPLVATGLVVLAWSGRRRRRRRRLRPAEPSDRL
jgi:hypothetical protein